MCACNVKTVNYSNFSLADIMRDENLRKTLMDRQIISSSSFSKGDPSAHFLWAYCISPEKLNAAFEPFGLEIKTSADAKALADLNKQGLDMSGKLTGKDGKSYKANFFAVLQGIHFTPEETQNNSCNIVFAQ